jgi:hypothetical protein
MITGLVTGVVAAAAVHDLYLAGARYRKSLSRSFMCLNLSHFNNSF